MKCCEYGPRFLDNVLINIEQVQQTNMSIWLTFFCKLARLGVTVELFCNNDIHQLNKTAF